MAVVVVALTVRRSCWWLCWLAGWLLQTVSREEAASLAKSFGMSYFETSAKKGTGVEEAFRTIAEQVVERLTKEGGARGGAAAAAGGAGTGGAAGTTVALKAGDGKKAGGGGCCGGGAKA